MKRNWRTDAARGAVAALLGVGLVAASADCASAQFSFGKARDAAEQAEKERREKDKDANDGGANADSTDDEDDAFDVDPNDRAADAPKSDADAKNGSASGGKGKTSVKPARRPVSTSRGNRNGANGNGANGAASGSGAGNVGTNGGASNPNDGTLPDLPESVAPTIPGDVDATQPVRIGPTSPNGANAGGASNGTNAEKVGSAGRAAGSNSNAAESEAVDPNKRGPLYGKAKSTKYRAGMIFEARPGGECKDVFGSAPVPTDFPEQKVRTLEEDFPNVARVAYRDLKEGGARQMIFKMRQLRSGQRVEATVLFEVTRRPILPPTDPTLYSIPKRVDRDVLRYLKKGRYMESSSRTIRTLAKDLTKDVDGDWAKVDAFFKYVRENVKYKEAQIEKPMRGALAALKTRDGDCEDMSALFISLCRASDIPARLVRVPGHCWAEFYLVDDKNDGYWFPAQVAGTEPLGSMQDLRVILQKGDAFRLPESPQEETLYVKELFTGSVKEGSPDPIFQFIQEPNAQ